MCFNANAAILRQVVPASIRMSATGRIDDFVPTFDTGHFDERFRTGLYTVDVKHMVRR